MDIPTEQAVELKRETLAPIVKEVKKTKDPQSEYLGSGKKAANRKVFGAVIRFVGR